jgi:geranylgeranyl diphosphate synthase type II
MSTPDAKGFFESARDTVNIELAGIIADVNAEVPGVVGEAMAYSLEASGKRFRPALLLAVYGELGGTANAGLISAAIEIVHTYSLVHDDLPCMDNDELRRGRPTTHVKFGTAAATEAAFRMVPLASRVLARGAERLELSEKQLARLASELFESAGASGMVGGQVLDLEAEGLEISVDELVNIHRMKTGALITASAVLGAIAANGTNEEVEAMREFGKELGLAFQIVDDILDSTATSQELGKTAGKDAEQQKATFTTILSHDQARAEADACIARAIGHLESAGLGPGLLNDIAAFIVNRRS